MPTLIQDRPVQPRLLAHHSPRIGKSAFGTGSHTLDVELFKHHGAKAIAEIPRNSMVPILADAPLTAVWPRHGVVVWRIGRTRVFGEQAHVEPFSFCGQARQGWTAGSASRPWTIPMFPPPRGQYRPAQAGVWQAHHAQSRG